MTTSNKVYLCLQAKKAPIDHLSLRLKAYEARFKRLIGWGGIQRTVAQLPAANIRRL